MKKVQDPDRPHGYKPRVLTVASLPARSQEDWKYAVQDAGQRPCDVCGGSRFGLRIHNITSPRPSLARALAAIAAAS